MDERIAVTAIAVMIVVIAVLFWRAWADSATELIRDEAEAVVASDDMADVDREIARESKRDVSQLPYVKR